MSSSQSKANARKTASALSRRGFLEIISLAGGAVALRQGLFPAVARAAGKPNPYLLLVYFSGGWDQLLALDPRSATDPRFAKVNAVKAGGTGIETGYPESADGDPEVAALMTATGGTGLQTRGAIDFGPAVHPELLNHSDSLCVVRGMSMDTLTHEVGRRYLLTGKFPRGLAPNGSSLTTVVAGQADSNLDLANLLVGVEGYNDGSWPSKVSPIGVNSAADVLGVLRPIGAPLSAANQAALDAFEGSSDSCEARGYDESGIVGRFRASQQKAKTLVSSTNAALFQFSVPPPTGNTAVAALFNDLQINTFSDLAGPKGKAALAAQALTQNISQAVAVTIARDLDDHFDESGSQSVKLRAGFEALGLLIKHLKATAAPGGQAGSFWDHTTMMVFSEFSRTPLMNGRAGRDHHLASSCLLAGPGIQGNRVVGATTNQAMSVQKWNLSTGAPDPAGSLIHPQDVHATVLKSMGLTYDHLSNQSPNIIAPILK